MYEKATIISLLFCLIVVIVGCESNAVRREEAYIKNPDWSELDKKMIAQGMINRGMTKEQVRAAWGQPCQECLGTKIYDSGIESWEYQTQVVFFDKAGKVTRWVER